MRVGGIFAVFGLVVLWSAAPYPVTAQGFDCTKATGPVERAICGSSTLRQADTALAAAYAQASAQPQADREGLRQAQRAWLRRRQDCAARGADLSPCLTRSYAERLAQLQPRSAAPGGTQAPPAGQAALVPDAPRPALPVMPRPVTPRPVTPRPVPPDPAPARAALDSDQVPAAGQHSVLLQVASPGRFAIRAESATGAAIQLTDMLAGPGDVAGVAGQQDGRLDVLLDASTYKLRVFGAERADGVVRLIVQPFVNAGPAQAVAEPGVVVSTALADLQQRLLWTAVGPDGRIRIEAAGRSLGDLQLWREGRDLVEIGRTVRTIEPVAAHPMTDIVLAGTVPPGTYLVVAYGGPARPWTDGTAEQPLHVRSGLSPALLDGPTTGQVGPFGSEVFQAPDLARQAVLRLPQAAQVQIGVTQDGKALARAALDRRSRDPVTEIALPSRGQDLPPAMIEVQGAAGQPYSLQAFASGVNSTARPGLYWVAVQSVGLDGDERPSGFVLLRRSGTAASVVAGSGPVVGPAQSWRRRFNLRGPTSLLFQVSAPVGITARTDGPGVDTLVRTLDGRVLQVRGDGRDAGGWLLEPGWYELVLRPRDGAVGMLDLTIGPPGLSVPIGATPPASPIAPVGLQTVADGTSLVLRGNPGSTMLLHPAPLDLAAAPLVLTQAADTPLDIPVQVPLAGTLEANGSGAALLDPHPANTATLATLHVPAIGQARTVVVSWRPVPPALAPLVVQQEDLPALDADTPRFLTLRRDEERSFALRVAEGGLYRIETVGRLHTAGTIGTAFLPAIDRADANGIGQNMLMERMLRAGRYRVSVQAKDSAGRLGLLARPAATSTGPTLRPGGSVRATVVPGAASVFPIEIAAAGQYHLDLLALKHALSVRLEDEQGWPLLPVGAATSLDQDLAPGRYRLVILPTAVETRAVVRLTQSVPAVAIEGHGPHALPFEAQQAAEWREPAGRDAPRTPDTWLFGLDGPADVTLGISDGMVAELWLGDAATPMARLVGPAPFTGTLAAGTYRLTATSLGRNDRLPYTLDLTTRELQPATPRVVSLPATIPFALADSRIVSVTSFGSIPLRATLRNAAGTVVDRADGRVSDWNIGLSRALPADRYTLELTKLAPPSNTSKVAAEDQRPTSNGADATTQTDEGDDTSASQNPPTEAREPASMDATEAPTADASDTETPDQTTVTLLLPAPRPTVVASDSGYESLEGGGVQTVALPAAAPGQLLVVAASSSVETVLALEKQSPDGTWSAVGQDQGLTPMLAAPVDMGAWRARVWALDGGPAPIRFAGRSVGSAVQGIDAIAFAPVPLGGLGRRLGAALVGAPGAAALRLARPVQGLHVASTPGQPAQAVTAEILVPQSDKMWLLADNGPPAPVRLQPLDPAPGVAFSVGVPRQGVAVIGQPAAASGRVRAWLATSGLGQPGADGGAGMGVAAGSSLALGGAAPLRLWNAGGDDSLTVRLTAADLALAPVRQVDLAMSDQIAAGTALPLRLPAGRKRLELVLGAGAAAVAGWRDAGAVTAWSGSTPLARTMEGDWTDLLLLNPGPDAVSVSVLSFAVPTVAAITGQGVLRRFSGAAGSILVPVSAVAGQRLVVAGAAATWLGQDGQVRQGNDIQLGGPGLVALRHGPGLLAAWLDGAGASPWGDVAAQAVDLPAHLVLSGASMAVGLRPEAPVLIRGRSTAPVIMALGRDAPPTVYAAGAVFGRYLPAGRTELRLLSPTDGPLTGTLDLVGTPVTDAREGLGASVVAAPGTAVLWGFTVTQEGPVGAGVQAQPDQVEVRLLDEAGRELGTGVSLLRRLTPGRYLLEARLPLDADTATVRPALYGLSPPHEGPPADVVRRLMIAAGLTPPT